jgi:hypothetical protein
MTIVRVARKLHKRGTGDWVLGIGYWGLGIREGGKNEFIVNNLFFTSQSLVPSL